VRHLEDPGPIYEKMMDIMCDITNLGLIHCDYNEFNVMLGPDRQVTVIDFPQMVSVSHENAQELFDRDVDCVMRFFRKKLNYWMEDSDRPDFAALVRGVAAGDAVDCELRASGFKREDGKALSMALQAARIGGAESSGSEASSIDDARGEASDDAEWSWSAGRGQTPGSGADSTVNEGSGSLWLPGQEDSVHAHAELPGPRSSQEQARSDDEESAQERQERQRRRSAAVRALRPCAVVRMAVGRDAVRVTNGA
jgi:RIO kinase 2